MQQMIDLLECVAKKRGEMKIHNADVNKTHLEYIT